MVVTRTRSYRYIGRISFNKSKNKDTHRYKYSGTWELGTPKALSKSVLNSEVVLFLKSISMYWIDIGSDAVVLNSQVVPISHVVVKTGYTVPIHPHRKP